MAVLDAEQFQRRFVAWVASFYDVPEGVIAIDGKTVRRSHDKAEEGGDPHGLGIRRATAPGA